MPGEKILLVDDEPEIRNMLSIFLGVEDYEIHEADNGKAALRQAIAQKPDLILLDLGLPDMDGNEVIEAIRKFSNVPVIVLTARTEDQQVVQALNLGADDYVTKPFRADILLARIKANLRHRGPANDDCNAVENGPVRIDLDRHEVMINGKLAAFTPKEFNLLHLFVANKGKMITHKQILREVWGPQHVDDTQYLRVYIGQVRNKLEAAAGLGASITSESGIGYRMEALGPATSTAAA